MKKIGILSDTHTYFDDKLRKFFEDVDELWHAGDIGGLQLADEIAKFKPLRAVHGNIDDAQTRIVYPEVMRFKSEESLIAIAHITGYPERYTSLARSLLVNYQPNILIGGHSHILRIMFDKRYNCLYINPGASGLNGFHSVRTAVRFVIEGTNFRDMEVGEWSR